MIQNHQLAQLNAELRALREENAEQREAIAKKDAALRACVEALERSEPYLARYETAHEAAIAQAEKELK